MTKIYSLFSGLLTKVQKVLAIPMPIFCFKCIGNKGPVVLVLEYRFQELVLGPPVFVPILLHVDYY